jgi:hypothetical protein
VARVEIRGMAMRSKDTIILAALSRCGRSSAADEPFLAQAIDANYDEIVRSAFEDGDGNYPFGRARIDLTSRSEGTMGYADAFTVPSNTLHIVEVYLNDISASDMLQDWEFDGAANAILIDGRGGKVEAEIVRSGQEATWSGFFAKGVQLRIEAVIKDALDETEEAMAKEQEGDLSFLKAGVKGSKNRSPKPMFRRGGGRLMRARRTPDRGY